MATAPLTDRRSARAAGIVERQDIHESKPGVFRVRDVNGSGIWHITTANHCDCTDFARNGLACKHMLAVSNWSSKQSGPVCPDCGAAATPDTVWAGKRGWLRLAICTRDKYHKATRLT